MDCPPGNTGQQTRQVACASHGLIPPYALIVVIRSRAQVVLIPRAISMVGVGDLSLQDLRVACTPVNFVEAPIGHRSRWGLRPFIGIFGVE